MQTITRIEKNAVQSYGEAIKAGHFKTKLKNEWKRMLAMDVSDVYYDKILMNGKPSTDLKRIEGKQLKAVIKSGFVFQMVEHHLTFGLLMLAEKLQLLPMMATM
jgi:hypothetical protein